MMMVEQPAKPLLDISNLTIDFRTDEGLVRAVNNVNMRIHPGEVMGLVGESGSGKSATAKAIMRLHPGNALVQRPSHIELFDGINSVDVLSLSGRNLRTVRGGEVSMIFQEPMASFAPAIPIGEQIIETIGIHLNHDRDKARRIGIELFDRVGIPMPDKRFDQYVFELSGGMRQRAMIAMALATQPKLLIADEPTTALDVTIQAQVLELMMELREQMGMAILFITHDLGVISKVADNVTVMRGGEVVEAGTCERVLFKPQHDYTKRLLDALPHLDELPETPAHTPEPIVQVKDLEITYPIAGKGRKQDSFTAVKNISLDLPKGQIIGLVGESGSGKSVTAKTIMRLNPNNAIVQPGSQLWLNHNGERTDILSLRGRKLRTVRGGAVSMIFQEPMACLDPTATIGEQMEEAVDTSQLTGNFLQRRRQRKTMSENLLHKVGIKHHEVCLKSYPHQLTEALCQRVMIAMAIARRPLLLIADEPTAAMESTNEGQIFRLLASLNQLKNMSMLLISHDLENVTHWTTAITVMYSGQFVEAGTTEQIFKKPFHPYTQALVDSSPNANLNIPVKSRLMTLPGSIPILQHLPIGCRLGPRCPRAQKECVTAPKVVNYHGHQVSCHYPLRGSR